MKITISSTSTLTKLGGVPVRLWEGVTETGTPCKVFVHRIAVCDADADPAAFAEVEERLPPGHYYPFWTVL